MRAGDVGSSHCVDDRLGRSVRALCDLLEKPLSPGSARTCAICVAGESARSLAEALAVVAVEAETRT
jgi:hypothetical protein